MSLNRMFLDQDQWKKCHRRVPRADLSSDLAISLSFPELSPELSNEKCEVKTIGELGAYCLSRSLAAAVKPGQKLKTGILVNHEYFTVEGQVRYVAPDGFALEFLNAPPTLRAEIREMFKPELLARSLAPFLTYAGMDTQAQVTLIYSDGESNSLHVSLANDRIQGVSVELEILDTRIAWKKNGPLMLSTFSGRPVMPDRRKRVLNFVRNLQGLESSVRESLENLVAEGQP